MKLLIKLPLAPDKASCKGPDKAPYSMKLRMELLSGLVVKLLRRLLVTFNCESISGKKDMVQSQLPF